MKEEVLKILEQVEEHVRNMLDSLCNEREEAENLTSKSVLTAEVLETMEGIIPNVFYEQYKDFFTAFILFCRQCGNEDFLISNRSNMISSLRLLGECLEDLKYHYRLQMKKCPCCGHEVVYNPLPDYYKNMQEQYHMAAVKGETLNEKEYSCPDCGASDRDRLIISYLIKAGLQEAPEGVRVLQIAPAASISSWITKQCPQIMYETTDLYMKGVSYQANLMDMNMVHEETYDLIICSHVLEHVRDDRKALSEMKRILKPDGKVVFLVPVDLNTSDIDEEWGLPEAENWRRFGQGDHCRMYGKEGLLQRLEEQFYVYSLNKDYFGEDIFNQCALSDTSTLYVLVKSGDVPLMIESAIEIDEKLCEEGPLVSVVLPCFNHERYVAEAIESVLNQSYKNIELLVADDGSTDNTAAVMRRYSSYFAKELYLTENTGGEIYYQLKQLAHGKYIALMHSDDIWEKDKLAIQVTYMEQHEECGSCLAWCVYTDEHLRECANRNPFKQVNRSSQEWMNYFWKNGNVLCNPSSLTRRELDIKLKRKAFRQLPDFFSWIDMIQETVIYIIPKVLVKMRQHLKDGQENVSFPTKENLYRHMIEEGGGWLSVIRDMRKDFFKDAFASALRNPDANTKEEILCEKYFLLLNHRNVFVQNSALYYFQEIYDYVQECMEKEYHYTRIDYARDMVNKGIAQLFLGEETGDAGY